MANTTPKSNPGRASWHKDATCHVCGVGLYDNPTSPTTPQYVWSLYRQNHGKTPAVFACANHDTTGMPTGELNTEGRILMRILPPRVKPKRPIPEKFRPHVEMLREKKRLRLQREAEANEIKGEVPLIKLTQIPKIGSPPSDTEPHE